MTRKVATIAAEATLSEAALLMAGHGVKRLPVVADGLLVGIVTRADLTRALAARSVAPPTAERPSDRELQRRVEAEFGTAAPGEWLIASVRGGIARLEGTTRDDDRHYALLRQVAAIPGVAEIEDRLVTLRDTPR